VLFIAEEKQYFQRPKVFLMNANQNQPSADRLYWVVSPNVKYDEKTVGEWRTASVREGAAFMGWEPHDQGHGRIGPKFAGLAMPGVKPGHVILIARRHQHEPEMVGFGVVRGEYATQIAGFTPPQEFGSLRRLSPFKAWSKVPPGIPLIEVLQHTRALVQLHPDWEGRVADKEVCTWVERELNRPGLGTGQEKPATTRSKSERERAPSAEIVDQPEDHQLDYNVQTKARITRAKNIEFGLLRGYWAWLEHQDRKLALARYGKLQCDGNEERRKNLIEAKASTRREHVRMAVGQLLDYAFQGEKKLGRLHKAILVPARLDEDIEKWLRHLDISIIWREGKSFFDNANGQFA